MKYTMRVIPLDSIVVGERFREDLGNIQELSESIREKGLIQPLSVNADMVLLAGGRRYNACKALGLDKIPVMVREGNDPIDNKEIELFENIHRKELTWQEEAKLIACIHELYKTKGLSWTGRKTAQIIEQSEMNVSRALRLAASMQVLPELGNCKTADEAHKILKKIEEEALVEELSKRQKKLLENTPSAIHLGDIGTHKVMSVDLLVKNTVSAADRDYRVQDTFVGLSHQKKDTFSFIECDPPYGVDLDILTQREGGTGTSGRDEDYNEIKAEDYPSFLQKLCKELYRVAKPNSWMIFWFAFKWQQNVKEELQQAGWTLDEVPAIWSKPIGRTPRPDLLLARTYEPFYICRKGQAVLARQGLPNVFGYYPDLSSDGTVLKDKYHPAQRPVNLMKYILSVFLDTQIHKVLIPFAGSGSTLRACYQLGYVPLAFDNNDRYKKHFLLAIEKDVREASIKKGSGDVPK